MRLILSILLNLIIFQFALSQSIIVNPAGQMESSLDAEELTREVLIDGGECSDISNFTLKENNQAPFPNANRSWGYFQKGNSDFPFEEGIVLTTGFANKVIGPGSGSISDGSSAWTGDSDANVLPIERQIMQRFLSSISFPTEMKFLSTISLLLMNIQLFHVQIIMMFLDLLSVDLELLQTQD